MTDSSAPKRRPSPRVTDKPTGGTPAVDGPTRRRAIEPLIQDLRDLVVVLERETPEPGTVAHRLVRQCTLALALALGVQAEPGIDITAIRATPFPFAFRDLDVTVTEPKHAEAVLEYMRTRGGLGEPLYRQQLLDHRDPPQVHHQWEVTWGELVVRIGTVVHPDDAGPAEPAQSNALEASSPDATSDEPSTDPREV